MRRARSFALWTFCVAAALAPLRAGAIDLTGSWREVKNSPCTQVNGDGTTVVYKGDQISFSPLGITQTGHTLAIKVLDAADIGLVGWVHADAKKDEGRGLMRQCLTDFFSGYQILSAKTFPENGKGISGRMLVTSIYGSSGSTRACRVIFERYDTADPTGLGCP